MGGTGGTGNLFKNNLAYNCDVYGTTGNGTTPGYDTYIYQKNYGSETGGENITANNNPFVDSAHCDYRLKANTTATQPRISRSCLR